MKVSFIQTKDTQKQLKAIIDCTYKNDIREVLQHIEVVLNDDKLTFTATNSYILGSLSIKVNIEGEEEFNKLLNVTAIKALSSIKPNQFCIIETVDSETIKTGGLDSLIETKLLNKPFPDWKIILKDLKPEAIDSISFNAKLLFTVSKVLDNETYSWEFSGSNKPIVAKTSNALAMVMPIRA